MGASSVNHPADLGATREQNSDLSVVTTFFLELQLQRVAVRLLAAMVEYVRVSYKIAENYPHRDTNQRIFLCFIALSHKPSGHRTGTLH